MKYGQTVNREFPLPWKRSFAHEIAHGIDENGIAIRKIKSNLNELERLPPHEFGNMRAHYVE